MNMIKLSVWCLMLGMALPVPGMAEGRSSSKYDKNSLPPGVKLHGNDKHGQTGDASQTTMPSDAAAAVKQGIDTLQNGGKTVDRRLMENLDQQPRY